MRDEHAESIAAAEKLEAKVGVSVEVSGGALHVKATRASASWRGVSIPRAFRGFRVFAKCDKGYRGQA